MQLRYTILYVDNVVETLEFYEKAFGLERAMLHESLDYAELKTGNTKLAFSSTKLMQELGKTPGVADVKKPTFEIAFETDNVKEALQKALQEGAALVQDAREEPWGQVTSYVSDKNGFLIEICSPVKS